MDYTIYKYEEEGALYIDGELVFEGLVEEVEQRALKEFGIVVFESDAYLTGQDEATYFLNDVLNYEEERNNS